jgi:hypothetical protein
VAELVQRLNIKLEQFSQQGRAGLVEEAEPPRKMGHSQQDQVDLVEGGLAQVPVVLPLLALAGSARAVARCTVVQEREVLVDTEGGLGPGKITDPAELQWLFSSINEVFYELFRSNVCLSFRRYLRERVQRFFSDSNQAYR